jgi:hypothetical protein
MNILPILCNVGSPGHLIRPSFQRGYATEKCARFLSGQVGRENMVQIMKGKVHSGTIMHSSCWRAYDYLRMRVLNASQ